MPNGPTRKNTRFLHESLKSSTTKLRTEIKHYAGKRSNRKETKSSEILVKTSTNKLNYAKKGRHIATNEEIDPSIDLINLIRQFNDPVKLFPSSPDLPFNISNNNNEVKSDVPSQTDFDKKVEVPSHSIAINEHPDNLANPLKGSKENSAADQTGTRKRQPHKEASLVFVDDTAVKDPSRQSSKTAGVEVNSSIVSAGIGQQTKNTSSLSANWSFDAKYAESSHGGPAVRTLVSADDFPYATNSDDNITDHITTQHFIHPQVSIVVVIVVVVEFLV